MNIAIIPARGGSQRIPGKNIKPFLGKPIIAYSIEAALACGQFERVIVSTDSSEIADVARQYGADTPFMRPSQLADHHTATAPVILHALDWLEAHDEHYTHACCIYATAPFVRAEYLQQGLNLLQATGCSSCYPVATFPFPIFRASRINDNGCLQMFWPEYEMTRSQDLPEAYHDAGQFYWVNVEKFRRNPQLYANDSRPIIIPRHLVQDIDTTEDWIRAEYMYKVAFQTQGNTLLHETCD